MAAINKNFVIKNGVEIGDNLIYGDKDNLKVGIGTTVPGYTLDVRGGIGATNITASGTVTANSGIFTSFSATSTTFETVTFRTGIGTELNISGVTTTANLRVSGIATFNENANVVGLITTRDLNVVGIATVETLDVQTKFDVYDSQAVFHNDVYIAGNLSIGGTTVSITASDLRVSDRDIVLGVTTDSFGGDISNDTTANHGGIAIASTEGNPLISLQSVGINSLPDTYKQLMWVRADTFGIGTTDAWLFNYGVGIGSTLVPNGVRFAVTNALQVTDSTTTTPNLVSTNSITGNSVTINSIQVGSSLTVTSGIATNLNVTGVGTVSNLSSGIATITTADVTLLDADFVSAPWIQVGSGLTFTTGIGTNLNVSGVGTVGSLSIGSDQVISSGRELQNIASLDATTTATIEAAIANAPNTFSDLTVTGIATFNNNVEVAGIVTAPAISVSWAQVGQGVTFTTGIGTALNITGITTSGSLNVTGFGTIGNIAFRSTGSSGGIITATDNTGIVTYYGDGSKLTGIISGVGIQSGGTSIGYGITELNFIGSAVTSIISSAGIATINLISGSGGGGTPGGSDGQVQYNDSSVFAGSSNFTFDGNNVNVGGKLTAKFVNSTWSQVGSGLTFTTGIGTNLNVTGVGTIAQLVSTNVEVSGITTVGFITATNLHVSGITTAQDFDALSDYRYKTDITTVSDALSKVSELRGVRFNWKESGLPSYGVVAQELEQVLPELVHGHDPKTVNYNGIIGVLIEAIKDLKEEISTLKDNINK